MSKLEILCPETDKDEMIARLLLQKADMYVEYTEGWLDGFLSESEMNWIDKYATYSDKKHYSSSYKEILRYIREEEE